MSTSVRETPCVYNPASDEGYHACEWCQSMIDFEPRKGWNIQIHPEEHERAMALFGGPGGSSKKKWKTLMNNIRDSEHVSWARLESGTDPLAEHVASSSEFRLLADSVLKGNGLSSAQEIFLQEGIKFRDGSTLRFLDSSWSLNGVHLHGLSLYTVFSLLGEADKRMGWDIPALLLLATSVMPERPEHLPRAQRGYFGGVRRGLHSPYRPLSGMLLWLSNRLKVDRTLAMESSECVPMLAWAHDIQTHLLGQHPVNMERLFQNALSNHPPGLFHAYDTPWMRSWQSFEKETTRAQTQKWALELGAKNLKFRTRTNSGPLRLIQVPNEPNLWAFLCSLALSPLSSEAGTLLLGLQHNWSVAYVDPGQPSEPLVKSLQFCHEIMNGLERNVFLQHDKALVLGKIGHFYEISVGHGQHGAPYNIQHVVDINPNRMRRICIHSGHFARKVPLGDTLGGVLLSMVNDLSACRDIESLDELIFSNPPFGFPYDNIPQHWLDAIGTPFETNQHSSLDNYRWGRAGNGLQNQRRPRRALHELIMRNRHSRNLEARSSTRWIDSYGEALENEGEFPYNDVVEEWRRTVRPYEANRHERPSDRHWFGDVHEAVLQRRFHHLMNHRRFDDVHPEGDIRDGERRWCEVFARVWEVLVLQPMNATFRLPNTNGSPLSFEHTALQVTVRSDIERTFLSRIGRALGYVKHDVDGQHTVYVRRDHPRPNARLRLTELLRDAQIAQRVRGAPPRWWNYVDVVAPPHNVPHFRWQLHVDHRDQRKPISADPNGQQEFIPDGLFG